MLMRVKVGTYLEITNLLFHRLENHHRVTLLCHCVLYTSYFTMHITEFRGAGGYIQLRSKLLFGALLALISLSSYKSHHIFPVVYSFFCHFFTFCASLSYLSLSRKSLPCPENPSSISSADHCQKTVKGIKVMSYQKYPK